MKIGLLGGSFDPLHEGHVYAAQIAMKRLGLRQVWFVPTAQNPLKKMASASYLARLERCQEGLKKYPRFFAKDFEKHSVSTYDLVRFLQKKYPRFEFVWIMGYDSFLTLPMWKNWQKLVKIVRFAIVSRETIGGFSGIMKMPAKLANVCSVADYKNVSHETFCDNLPKIEFLRVKGVDASSSAIRGVL